jgi:hypothetical protein
MAGMPLEEKSYDNNGVLRSRTMSEYKMKSVAVGSPNYVGIATASRDVRPTRSVTFTFDPSSPNNALATFSKTEYDEIGSTVASDFSHLNVKKSKSYDYFVIDKDTAKDIQNTANNWNTIEGWFSGKLDKTAETDYDYSRTAYKAISINSFATKSRVRDKNGNIISIPTPN